MFKFLIFKDRFQPVSSGHQYESVKQTVFVDISGVFDEANFTIPCEKIPETSLDTCSVTFANEGARIVTVKQSELNVDIDFEPGHKSHFEFICGRNYCFTFHCHGISVDHK